MLSKEQKLESLKSFLEINAFATIDGHDANDGPGCKGHEEAFRAKAEELLALIETDNYGYAPKLETFRAKSYGSWNDSRDMKAFLDRLTEEQYEQYRTLGPGQVFVLFEYDNGSTWTKIETESENRLQLEARRQEIQRNREEANS